MDAIEQAKVELEKASRKAQRMFTRKQFREPTRKLRAYKPPVYPGGHCENCGRPKSYHAGRRCRECFQAEVRANHAAAVLAEHERVSAAEAAFKTIMEKDMKSKPKALPTTPITRSTSGLRAALFEEMEALRSGNSDAQRARSVAMMANSILQSVQVEIEYHKYVREAKPKADEKVIPLGTDVQLAA